VRNLARAAATAALTVTAVIIPLTGTATASPAQSPRAVHTVHDFDDRCDDFGHHRYRHGSWDRHWNRWSDDCRYHWDRRGHRSYWHNGHWRNRNHADCSWNYGRRY
jgi:hypothetical protein